MTPDVAAHNRRIRDRAREQCEEEDRWARLDRARHCFVIPSRSRPGVSYDTVLRGLGDVLAGSCTCQASEGSWPLGALPCWHAAAGARAMELAGLVAWDDDAAVWRLTDAAPRAEAPPVPPREDTRPTGRRPAYGTDEYRRSVSALVD